MAYRATRRISIRRPDGTREVLERGQLISNAGEIPNMGSLEALRWVERVESSAPTRPVSETRRVAAMSTKASPRFDLSILDNSIADMRDLLEDVDDVDHLEALVKAERGGKTRAGAIKALESRLEELAEVGS